MKKRHILSITALALTAVIAASSLTMTHAANTPPDKPAGNPGGGPGASSSASVTYNATKKITSDTTESSKTYSSSTADESALLVSGAKVTESSLTVSKTGDSNGGDNCNFYGQNAAVLAKDGATLTIKNATIESSASGANGVFSYGGNGGQNGAAGDGTTVVISDSSITTTGDGSGGIMTTGGGVTKATNLTVKTSGQSSAAIRTDRGGGTVTVNKGSYTTTGLGSPAVYSTADITVKNATLTSKLSEGVVIEGLNSVTLTDTDLTANNTKTNGNATHYDTVFLYQSMSGDSATGTSTFTMKGGSITSKNGEVFHVTNTTGIVNLEDVSITNSDSDNVLFSVTNDGWSGSDNTATLNATNQVLEGNIVVSNAAVNGNSNKSTLTLNLKSGSAYKGAINSTESSRGTVNVTMDSNSIWQLTGDSYVDSISGSGKINYNGYKLYVNGKAYSSDSPYTGLTSTDETVSTDTATQKVTFKNVKKTISESSLSANSKTYSVIKKSSGGKVSVTKYYGKAKNYISVSKTGKVTIKKGTPAGTYKLKIKVAAKGNYKVTSKTITITVK